MRGKKKRLFFICLFVFLISCDLTENINKPRSFPERKIPGKPIYLKVMTIWRDDELHYKLWLYPYEFAEKSLLSNKNEITINFIDKHDFKLLAPSIKISEMTMIVNRKGLPIMLEYESSIDCSRKKYREIEDCNLGWVLPDVPDEDSDFKSELVNKIIELSGRDGKEEIDRLKKLDVYDLLNLKDSLEGLKSSKDGNENK